MELLVQKFHEPLPRDCVQPRLRKAPLQPFEEAFGPGISGAANQILEKPFQAAMGAP